MDASSSPRGLILRGIVVLAVGAALLAPTVAGADDDAVDWQNVKTHLENWINALSTALPAQVGAPAAALGAMPSSLKGGLTMRCHQNLRRIQGELMDHPDLDAARRAELQLLLEKNQHVLDALNGRPQGLEDFLRRHQQQGGGAAGGSPTPTMAEDERGFMDDLLGRYRTRLEALQKQAGREHKTFARLRDEATAMDKEISEIAGWAKDASAVGRTPEIMQGACDHLEDAQRRAQAWAVAVLDGETSCNRALDEAEQRAADCRTDADVALIRRRWVEAKRSAAQMAKDLEFADQSAAVARRTVKVLADYQDVVKLKQVQEAARTKRKRLTAVSDDIDAKVDAMLDSLATLEGIQAEAAALREQVRRSRADYVPLFPESKPQWDALEQTLEADLSLMAPDRSSNRFEWSRKVTRAREDLDALLVIQAPSCTPDDRTDKIIERAAAAKDAVMLRLAAAEHVLADADRCARGSGASPTPTAAASAPGTSASPTPAGLALLGTPPATPTAVVAFAGGLRIQGPATLVAGHGGAYLGTDGAGTPYPDGVTWNVSREDLLTPDGAGGVVAQKPGRATIIAHREDMTAFLEVEILAVVPDVTGLSLQQAVQRLQAAGLRGGAGGFSAAGGQGGTVVGQSLPPGSTASAGTMVALGTEAGSVETEGGEDRQDGEGLFSSAGGSPASAGGGSGGGPAGPDCGELEATFTTAMDMGDLGWAQSALGDAGGCPFHGQGQATLAAATQQAQQEAAATAAALEHERCSELEERFEGAMAAGNWQMAQAALQAAGACAFAGGARSRFDQAVRDAMCRQLEQRYRQLMAAGAPGPARTVLQTAQSKGCTVPMGDINLLNQAIAQQQALSQQQQHQQEQQQMAAFNALMQTMGTIIQSQQGQSGGVTSLPENQLPPSGGGSLLGPDTPRGDPLNPGWTPLPSTPPGSAGSTGGQPSTGGGDQGSGQCRQGIRYPYRKALECRCLKHRGEWGSDTRWHSDSTGSSTSWGMGDQETACGPHQGRRVDKYFDSCIQQERCFMGP